MSNRYSTEDFKKHFNENMKDLGLDVPLAMFDSFNAAIANAALMVATLDTLGKGATTGALIDATKTLEKTQVAASVGATFYVGAIVGSIAVATAHSANCDARTSGLMVFLNRYSLNFKGATAFFMHHPEIMDTGRGSRLAYASKAATAGAGAAA